VNRFLQYSFETLILAIFYHISIATLSTPFFFVPGDLLNEMAIGISYHRKSLISAVNSSIPAIDISFLPWILSLLSEIVLKSPVQFGLLPHF
jgi:hypothetical protein